MLALVEDWVAAILPQKGIVRCFLLVQSYTQSQVWTETARRMNTGFSIAFCSPVPSG
jgi:hypothetical protein